MHAMGEKRLLQINELDEFCNEAYANARVYKERTKALDNKNIIKKKFSFSFRDSDFSLGNLNQDG